MLSLFNVFWKKKPVIKITGLQTNIRSKRFYKEFFLCSSLLAKLASSNNKYDVNADSYLVHLVQLRNIHPWLDWFYSAEPLS